MKKRIIMGLVIAFTIAVFGFKGPLHMDILELALTPLLVF